MKENLELLTTELRNEQSMNLDRLKPKDILTIMNDEDQKVALAVREVLADVETAIQFTVDSLKQGGRLIYMGAGTSGRLGVLDALECSPTFGTDPEMVQGLIAGGESAFTLASEGAEDDAQLGVHDLKQIGLNEKDTVIGLAASGRTPYVIGGLEYARGTGAKTVAISCNKHAAISKEADHSIEVIVGPEVLTGSTRLKAATAQKMILNMITTASMVLMGKVYENLMVDVRISNHKLKERAINTILKITGVSYPSAKAALEDADLQAKTAIVMIKAGVSKEEAIDLLEQANGFVHLALERAVDQSE
ncbi:N-acetylmuramic acid 6-phosphate etherase [Bacillus sp. BRMEA1]|uniref:N-acetylmuramic acid 6-phosphate etherase n=1 Tax=Neobacillus endophyticus TaxID=2738405 RepID=UPI0015641B4A|nr:N-acetylmuramic acid 6-phosphate etherase [Neobacillus endophyticus]NRD77994.1 N-acetylmuramic acid 6-phosphate etherase [Neobacillus endophyticus]